MKSSSSSLRNAVNETDRRANLRFYSPFRAKIFAMDRFKLIIEKHPDGFVSYPLGLKGVVVGQGDTYEEALADVKSAINFHIVTFGEDAFDTDSPVLEAFIAETQLAT